MNAVEKTNPEGNYIPVITRKEVARVYTNEILYIEKELRVVNIYTRNRAYRFYGKLDDVTRYLDHNFYRCHKSCILNFEKIIRMNEGVFYFSEGMTLQVGLNNYRHTRSSYQKYLEENVQEELGKR